MISISHITFLRNNLRFRSYSGSKKKQELKSECDPLQNPTSHTTLITEPKQALIQFISQSYKNHNSKQNTQNGSFPQCFLLSLSSSLPLLHFLRCPALSLAPSATAWGSLNYQTFKRSHIQGWSRGFQQWSRTSAALTATAPRTESCSFHCRQAT